MKLVQAGFICLTLWALAAQAFLPPLPSGYSGGIGGLSSILAVLIPIIFLAALPPPKPAPQCPENYKHTPMDPNTCIRFFNSLKDFDAARASCNSEGADLLKLDPANFDKIRQLADANKGTPTPCKFWVDAKETTDGIWSALDGTPIPAIPFFNPSTNALNTLPNECGFLDNTNGFYLIGTDCTTLPVPPQCYICQRKIIP